MEPARLGSTHSTSTLNAAPQRVIPLLQALSRAEELAAALALRLDPITQHDQPQNAQAPHAPTVTGRIHNVGDTLQYLLDNIEL